MEGRYIGENIRLIFDIMDRLNETNETGLMLSLDVEKAFDSVEWPYIFKALSTFGIGEQFLRWIKVLWLK